MLTYAGAIRTFALGMSITIWVKSRIRVEIYNEERLGILGKKKKKKRLGNLKIFI